MMTTIRINLIPILIKDIRERDVAGNKVIDHKKNTTSNQLSSL
jgi:hypothetical protein